jgi:Tau and MAP protein, tubulin-binding repeat
VGSRVGSLANVKHRPGGGDKKIFDDKEYMRQISESQGRSGPASLTNSVIGSSSQVPASLSTNQIHCYKVDVQRL